MARWLGLWTCACLALAPAACAQEARPGGIDGALSPTRDTPGQGTAVTGSDLLLEGTALGAPLFYGGTALLGPEPDWRPIAHTASAEGLTLALTLGVKDLTRRRRPYTWYPDADAAGSTDWCANTNRAARSASNTRDQCHSFWSGHTALTASATFSTATSLHLGRDLRPHETAVLFASAAALTATTGALRVAAGRHYASDVLVGGAVGVGLGVGVPLLWNLLAPP